MSGTTHKHRYKNAGLNSQELRRRREEEGVQLRKQKREQQLFKKRNVISSEHIEDDQVALLRRISKHTSLFISHALKSN